MALSKVWSFLFASVLLMLVAACYSEDTEEAIQEPMPEIRRIGENRVRVLLSARDDSLYHTNTNRQRRPCGFWRRLRGKC